LHKEESSLGIIRALEWSNMACATSACGKPSSWLAVELSMFMKAENKAHATMLIINRQQGIGYYFNPSTGTSNTDALEAILLPAARLFLTNTGLKTHKWRRMVSLRRGHILTNCIKGPQTVEEEKHRGPVLTPMGTCAMWSAIFLHLVLLTRKDNAAPRAIQDIMCSMSSSKVVKYINQINSHYGAWMTSLS
jgi:hypothetical protein